MIHPIPSGTRDVLPDESKELRAITEAVRSVLDAEGYGEVSTPALEYESVLARGGGAPPAYRVFDDHGEVLALRTDMTVPLARLVATRYPTAEPPLRFSYFAHAYRGVRPHRGQMREFLQAGVELYGAPKPEGTAEALGVLCRALDATGLKGYRIGLGSAAILPKLLGDLGVDEAGAAAISADLRGRDFVTLEQTLSGLGLGDEHADLLLRLVQRRGGIEVLEGAPDAAADSLAGLRGVYEGLDESVRSRVIFDLGLTRELTYYTGALFEVYAPGVGEPIGGGGRYDDLLGRFGRDLPAVGWALGIERLHIALAEENPA